MLSASVLSLLIFQAAGRRVISHQHSALSPALPTATPTPSSRGLLTAGEGGVRYFELPRGECSSFPGVAPVMDVRACAEAAALLGFSDEVQVTDAHPLPHGCFWKQTHLPGSRLWLSTNSLNAGNGAFQDRHLLCQVAASPRVAVLAGFAVPDRNGEYIERFGAEWLVNGRETYWDVEGPGLLYWCGSSSAWTVSGEEHWAQLQRGSCLGLLVGPAGEELGQSQGGWFEWQGGEWLQSEAAGVADYGVRAEVVRWRSPVNNQYCVQTACTSRLHDPDATDLEECKRLCAASPPCVAVSYWGPRTADGWQNKCFLSMFGCTRFSSTTGGQVFSLERSDTIAPELASRSSSTASTTTTTTRLATTSTSTTTLRGPEEEDGFPVTIENYVDSPPECAHMNFAQSLEPFSLFIGRHLEVDLQYGESHSFTYLRRYWLGVGVQDNGWYWRGEGAQPWEQNPDNAGMQIFVNEFTCEATTGTSIAGGAVPDARLVLGVSGIRADDGTCVVRVERLAVRGLCIAGAGDKQCCGPCSLFSSSNCCTQAEDGDSETCPGEGAVGVEALHRLAAIW